MWQNIDVFMSQAFYVFLLCSCVLHWFFFFCCCYLSFEFPWGHCMKGSIKFYLIQSNLISALKCQSIKLQKKLTQPQLLTAHCKKPTIWNDWAYTHWGTIPRTANNNGPCWVKRQDFLALARRAHHHAHFSLGKHVVPTLICTDHSDTFG